MSSSSRLVWHRRDLRIADNELYHNNNKQTIYSVYIFDPSDYSPRQTGISDGKGGQLHSLNHGPHFARRLIDAVHSLRRALQSLGGNLIIRTGNPLHIIPQLAKELLIDEVVFSEIPGHYEFEQSHKLKCILQHGGSHCFKVFTTCSLTLVHPDDLPTDPEVWRILARPNEKQKKRSKGKAKRQDKGAVISKSTNECNSDTVTIDPNRFEGMPAIMGDFRRVARMASVRELYGYPNPENIAKDFSSLDTGDIPSLKELTVSLLELDIPLIGCIPRELILKLVESAYEIPRNNGNIEEQSMLHLRNFVQKHAATADRSLCDVSNNNSSMLSLPLALGALSPRQVYHCIKEEQYKLETEQGQSPGDINWLISHMEMRDYFLFNCFREGASAYHIHPKKPIHKPGTPREWLSLSENQDNFIRWVSGVTALPLVDAGMKELIATGYTSNRVRQNMASVLTKDLKLDWRLGAEWYQLCLEDHCVAANFGNWAYFAGIGGDPKNRHFRTISQCCRYDPSGSYVRKWINVSANDREAALRPWAFDNDWPEPIVDPDTQLTFQDKEKLKKTGRIST
jgi:deoxyribodipyrimidine photo-lyase